MTMRRAPASSGLWCMLWLCALFCCPALPPGAAPLFQVSVQFPTGQPAQALDAHSPHAAAIRPGDTLTGLILIELGQPLPGGVMIIEMRADEAAIERSLTLHPPANIQHLESTPGFMRGEIKIPGRISPYLHQFTITAPSTPGRYSVELTLRAKAPPEDAAARDTEFELHGVLVLEALPPEQLTDAIRIERVVFPADADGRPWAGRMSDTVAWPSVVWSQVARILGRRMGHNPYEPYAWIGVALRNETPRSATVLVEAGPVQVDTPQTPNPDVAALFAYDWWQPDPGSVTQSQLISLAPGEAQTVALPLFVSPDTPTGRYAIPIKASGGGGEPLATHLYRFRVERERGGVAAFVIILAIVTAAAALMLPGYLRRLMPRLYVRQMVLVSLFGALIVAGALLVNVVNSPLQGLLGPFNAFVGGFFYRLLMAALWLSLLTLLPYRGVVTLTALIGYLIGGIFFGSFNPLDFILVGSGILYKEAMLWVWGATRALPPMNDAPGAPMIPPEPGVGFVWRVALALGLAEAASTFTSLALQMVFYRLYFADWYIWLVVVIQSFGYMALGVWLARGPARLVHRLSSPTL